MFEEWIEYWIKQGDELITDTIRMYKEAYHHLEKFKIFEDECKLR